MFWKVEKNVQDIIQFIVVILYKVISVHNAAVILYKLWLLYSFCLAQSVISVHNTAVILYKEWLLCSCYLVQSVIAVHNLCEKTITFSNVRLEVKSRKMYYKTSLHSCYLVQTVIIVHNLWERNNYILICKSCSEK